MSGKAPNGKKPVGSGARGKKDVDMKDSSSSKKGKEVKQIVREGDEEMTVVVPPTKGKSSKSSGPPEADSDGDVEMDAPDKTNAEYEPAVDPVVQAITGKPLCSHRRFPDHHP